jgi:hypothetical protein
VDVSDNAFGAKGLDACAALLEGQSHLISLKVSLCEALLLICSPFLAISQMSFVI